MLNRQQVFQILSQLDWSRGFNKEGLLRTLLQQNVALPNEFLSAIQPMEVYNSPEHLLQSVPDVVWTIHDERERRARGHVQIAEATQRTRTRQVD